MLNVCSNCGEYRADKIIDVSGPYAICPVCQQLHPFCHSPLLIVCGPSGVGKSTACQRLLGQMSEVVLLEGDLLWRPEFDKPEDKYRDFFEIWLRLAKSIAQSGRPVVLFNAGAIPENVEPCVERRYFTHVHYLAMVCDDEILVERLRHRLSWRNSHQPAFIEAQLQFNRWCKESAHKASPAMTLLNASNASIEEMATQVASWIRNQIG